MIIHVWLHHLTTYDGCEQGVSYSTTELLLSLKEETRLPPSQGFSQIRMRITTQYHCRLQHFEPWTWSCSCHRMDCGHVFILLPPIIPSKSQIPRRIVLCTLNVSTAFFRSEPKLLPSSKVDYTGMAHLFSDHLFGTKQSENVQCVGLFQLARWW